MPSNNFLSFTILSCYVYPLLHAILILIIDLSIHPLKGNERTQRRLDGNESHQGDHTEFPRHAQRKRLAPRVGIAFVRVCIGEAPVGIDG